MKLRIRILALIFVIGGSAYLVSLESNLKKQLTSKDWPTVEGEVNSTVAKPYHDKENRETLFLGLVRYEYAVNGKDYKGSMTDEGQGLKRGDAQTALADVAEYKKGMKVVVNYDPDDPTVGILKKGTTSVHFFLMIVISSGTVLFTVLLIFTIAKKTSEK